MSENSPETSQKSAPIWLIPLVICGFICSSLTISSITLYHALGDGKQGNQPIEDYYQRATNWDAEAQQRSALKENDWTLTRAITPINDTECTLTWKLTNSDGEPLQGATGSVEGFHMAHAAEKQQAELIELENGQYQVTWQMPYAGNYKGELRMKRGPIELLVPFDIEEHTP